MNAEAEASVERLQSRLPGRVWLPGQDGYGVSTPWDSAVLVQPAAVVAATAVEDVAATVRFAADQGWRVAVQATGHGGVPLGDDALLIHTGRLQECTVDEPARTVRVGAGATWQQVLDLVTPLGLAPVCGSSVNVGATGYLTGGGIGPLVRPLGLSSDYVVAVEVVTGDGEVRQVTAHSDPELFWAVCGGKSAVGIVTAVEIELLPIRTLYGGALFFDGADLGTVLTAWRDWSRGLPEQTGTSLAVMQLPPIPQVPPPLAGKITVAVRYASLADPGTAADALAPMTAAAPSIFGGTGPMPYAAIAGVHADPVASTPTINATALLPDLDDSALDQLRELTGPGSGSPQSIVELRQLGGALTRPLKGDSAFDARDAAYNLYISGDTRGAPRETLTEHGAQVLSALTATTEVRKLVNFVNSADPEQLRHCYQSTTLRRLLDLTDQYDPSSVLSRPLQAAGVQPVVG